VNESMGPIFDRGREHLGTSDAMVIQVRRRLIDAALALRDHGTLPPGADAPALYHIRSASVALPKAANWIEATKDTVRAFSGLPVAVA
jgi:phthalate 4,5-dioxygenase oxygenase subunit